MWLYRLEKLNYCVILIWKIREYKILGYCYKKIVLGR